MAQGRRSWRERVVVIAAEAVGGLLLVAILIVTLLIAVPAARWFADFMASLSFG